jgi:hypothetical protein
MCNNPDGSFILTVLGCGVWIELAWHSSCYQGLTNLSIGLLWSLRQAEQMLAWTEN